jgi:hypothetical protein
MDLGCLLTADCLLSDRFWFPFMQWVLASFAVYCFAVDRASKRRAGRGGTTLTVTRGEKSMALFYAAYATVTGVYVALTLQVELAKGYRTPLIVLDTLLSAYVCLFSGYFRGKLIGFSNWLAEGPERR